MSFSSTRSIFSEKGSRVVPGLGNFEVGEGLCARVAKKRKRSIAIFTETGSRADRRHPTREGVGCFGLLEGTPHLNVRHTQWCVKILYFCDREHRTAN